MCVSASIWTMGCGKSRHHSPDVSEIDLRNIGSFRNSSSSSNSQKTAGKHAKTRSSRHDKNGLDNDTGERPSSIKKTSNGKARPKEKNKDPGISLSSSSSSSGRAGATTSSGADGNKSNGATKPQGSYYLLEVPSEVYKAQETSSRITSKDVKTLTSTKTVHVTTSQLEFFKMLDEKIEMGGDYHTSNEASEVSSVDDAVRQ